MRTTVKPVAAAIMRVHKALFAPPPMRPTRSIRDAGEAKTIARVRKGQRNPLHDRAGDVGPRGRLAHAEQNAARIRIVERRPLAAEVGQKEKRAGSRIIRRRLTLERVRRRAEKPPGESERARAVEHRRHRVPAVWQRMGESVHELFRRAHISVGRDDELRRGSERDEGFARRDRAQAHRADRRVAAARREQNAARQAKRVRGLGPDLAHRRRSFEQGRRPGEDPRRRRRTLPATSARRASSSSQVPAASLMSDARSPLSFRRK